MANADRLTRRLAEEDDQTVGAKARLQAETDRLERLRRLQHPDDGDASAAPQQLTNRNDGLAKLNVERREVVQFVQSGEDLVSGAGSAMSGLAIHCQPGQQCGSRGQAAPTNPSSERVSRSRLGKQ